MKIKINEKLGVPEGLIDESKKLLKKIINDIKYRKDSLSKKLYTLLDSDDEDTDKISFLLNNYSVNISDKKFFTVPFLIDIVEVNVKKPILVSASYENSVNYKKNKDEIDIYKDTSKSLLKLTIAIPAFELPEVEKIEKIANGIIKIVENIDPSIISHEIMHFYDAVKNKKRKIKDLGDYKSYQINGFPKIISSFLFLLYFMTEIENKVRPTETYHKLLDMGVTKDNFKEFMESQKVIKMIRRAENFDLEEFKNKLKNDEEVNEFITNMKKQGFETSKDIAEDTLKLILINMSNVSFNTSRDFLQNYLDRKSIFVTEEEQEGANNFLNKLEIHFKKYLKNPNKYFEKLEKILNIRGKKMKKKLFKLYDMVKNNTENTKTTKDGKILNWDLHTKINSKNEDLKIEINFDSWRKSKG